MNNVALLLYLYVGQGLQMREQQGFCPRQIRAQEGLGFWKTNEGLLLYLSLEQGQSQGTRRSSEQARRLRRN